MIKALITPPTEILVLTSSINPALVLVMLIPKAVSLTTLTIISFRWAGIGAVIAILITVIRLVILSRLLSPADFGIFAAANTFTLFFAGLVQTLFGLALIQQRQTMFDTTTSTSALLASILMGATLGLTVYYYHDTIAHLYGLEFGNQVFALMAPALAARCIAYIPASILQRDFRFKEELICTSTSLLLGTAASITAALVGLGFQALVIGIWVETLTAIVLALVWTWRHFVGRPSVSRAFALLRNFGLMCTITSSTARINQAMQIFVVSNHYPVTPLGYFVRTQALSEAIAGSFFGPFINRLFRLFPLVDKDVRRLRDAFCIFVEIISIITLPLSAALYFSAESIVRIVLGERWMPAAILFGIFTLALMPRLCYKVTEFASYTLNQVNVTAKRAVFNLILTFILMWIASPFGIPAVASAIVVAVILNYIASASIAIKALDITWTAFIALHLRGALFSLVTIAAFSAIKGLPQTEIPIPVLDLGATVAAVLICIVFSWLIPNVFIGQRILLRLSMLRN